MKKMPILILVLSLAFLMGLFIFERGKARQYAAELYELKHKQAELEKNNQILDTQIKTLNILKQSLEQKLVALEKEKAELNQKLKESEKRLQDIQSQVASMTPDDMVNQTRRVLQDNGIERTVFGAQFSLSALQKNTRALLEWEEFSLVRIPALEQKINILTSENLNLQNQVFLWKETDRLWQRKTENLQSQIRLINQQLVGALKQAEKQKRKKYITSILTALAGFGLGALIK